MLSHTLTTPTRRWFPGEKLNRLASYAQGGLVLMAGLGALLWPHLDDDQRRVYPMAALSTLLSVGLGVLFDVMRRDPQDFERS